MKDNILSFIWLLITIGYLVLSYFYPENLKFTVGLWGSLIMFRFEGISGDK